MKNLGLCLLVILLAGCSSAGMAIKEKFGYAKREQLVAEVKDARDEQGAAKKQFASALEEFLAVTRVKTGELEPRYNRLKSEFERSESRAKAVHEEIADVNRVATALFREWRAELKDYANPTLRRSAERQLETTQSRYDRVYDSMRNAESKMTPVLNAFRDQVLFLKHNLNAQAIAGLQANASEIEAEVESLVREMEASIAESNAFIEQMQSGNEG